MKNIKNSILIILLTLISFSCSNEEVQDSDNLSAEELALELKNDIDFNQLVSKNANFSSILINKLQNSNIENKYSTQDDVNVNNLMADLGITAEYNKYIQEVNQNIQNVIERYGNINVLSEEKILSIINDLSIVENYSSNNFSKLSNDCDAQFQSDMQAIHNQYDNAVSLCTIATLLSGGLASPCYVYAVANASFQTAAAIDRHTICERNNQ